MSTTPQSKDQREELKNKAVETREAGRPKEALEMFKLVEAWDETNNNVKGQIDVLGHMRITYTRMGNQEQDTDKKRALFEKALEVIEKSVSIPQQHPEIQQGTLAVQRIHLASSQRDLALLTSEQPDKTILTKALKSVDEAILNLSGSKAHKAWPANLKAQLLFDLGRTEEALAVLSEAEKWLYEGYIEELYGGDQGELKINVWLSGLHLTRAMIYGKEGRTILAKHYINSVLQMDDPKNMLGERKKQAQQMLEKLSNP